MVFPKETDIVSDGDDLLVSVEIAAEAAPRRVRVTCLSKERFEEALLFLVEQYRHREPLLAALQLLLKREVDVEELTVLLRSRFQTHGDCCCVAVEESWDFDAAGSTGTSATPDLAAITPDLATKLTTPDPAIRPKIVGVCFGRISEEDSKPETVEFQDPLISFYSKTFPSPVIVTEALALIEKPPTPDPSDLPTPDPLPLRIFDIGAVSVDRELCSRLLCRALVSLCVRSAKIHKCAVMRCESTSQYLARACRSLGFTEIVDLPLEDFKRDNEPVEVELAYPHQCLRVLLLKMPTTG